MAALAPFGIHTAIRPFQLSQGPHPPPAGDLQLWHRPVFSGLQHVESAQPTLFVGSQTLCEALGVPQS